MRKLVLSAFTALALTSGAFAQAVLPTVVGVKFAGPGLDDGESPITIILDTMSMPCHENGSLQHSAALHGSTAVVHTPDTDPTMTNYNPYTLAWGNSTVNWDGNGDDNSDAFFTYDATTNTFSKTITPRAYFHLVPAGSIPGIAFVVNGATDVFDGNPWGHSLRATNSGQARNANSGADIAACYDIIVPFPIPAALRVTAVNGSKNVSNLTMQNSPNPFKGSTSIRYTVAKPGVVSMKVYDVLGKEVSTLVSGMVMAGDHKVTFDASNLNAGVYFYTTVIGGQVDTKRMIVSE